MKDSSGIDFPREIFKGLGLITGNEPELADADKIVDNYEYAKVMFQKGLKLSFR